MIEDINENFISIAMLLSLLSGLTWLRVIISMQATETFGPLITAVYRMIIDIGLFFFFYFMQLFAFSIIGSMAFFRVD